MKSASSMTIGDLNKSTIDIAKQIQEEINIQKERVQNLEAKILQFRHSIEASSNTSMTESGKQYLQTILYMYEEYFEITTQRKGIINEKDKEFFKKLFC